MSSAILFASANDDRDTTNTHCSRQSLSKRTAGRGTKRNVVRRQQGSQRITSETNERSNCESQSSSMNDQPKRTILSLSSQSPNAFLIQKKQVYWFAESRSNVWGATSFLFSWISYGCATMWLGLTILVAACTVSRLWTVRYEVLDDSKPVECGPTPIVTQTLATIGFGSCNKHDEPQVFWETVAEVLRRESTLAEEHIPEEAFNTENAVSTNGIAATLGSASNPHTCRRIAVPSVRRGIARPADAFVWLGDAVYLDGSAVRGRSVFEATEIAYSAMDVPIKGYENVSNPYYRAFKRSMAAASSVVAAAQTREDALNKSADESSLVISGEPERFGPDNSKKEAGENTVPSRIIGTWDDHDMGKNDGGKEFPYHSHTRGRFLDFLDISETDGLRKQDGIFSFHTISASDHHVVVGSSGSPFSTPSPSARSGSYRLSDHYENAFCIILLDVRTHRDPVVLSRKGDMLGETQWKWFEQVLKNNVSDGDVTVGTVGMMGRRRCAATIIGSGIQHLSSEKATEQWWNFKQSRQRLWRLLRKYKIGRAALISGDVHLMELIKAEPSFTGIGYPMIDFTSSGLTHQSGRLFDTVTKFRKYLTRILPMAISCAPRGLTPVGNDDAEGLKGRRCRSAFDLLPDWVFETIFPPMGWRVGHYLGRNVGAISLQVSLPSNSLSLPMSISGRPSPELSLRFSGYALSLKDREVFLPWRYESEVDEPSRDPAEAEGVKASDRLKPLLHAHAVTRHDQPLQVLEYLQPLRLLEIDSDKSAVMADFGSDNEGAESSEFDKSNHHWWKTITFTSQSVVSLLSSHPKLRILGDMMGFAAYSIPLGVSALWLVRRSLRGFGKKRHGGKHNNM